MCNCVVCLCVPLPSPSGFLHIDDYTLTGWFSALVNFANIFVVYAWFVEVPHEEEDPSQKKTGALEHIGVCMCVCSAETDGRTEREREREAHLRTHCQSCNGKSFLRSACASLSSWSSSRTLPFSRRCSLSTPPTSSTGYAG